mgnify:CR=1 FL=1
MGTADPTWMSLSLDGSTGVNPAELSHASVSLEEVATSLRGEGIVLRTERPEAPAQPDESADATSVAESSSSSSSASVSSVSLSVSESVSIESASVGVAVADPSAFAEEATEAIEVPLPAPVPVRLADEPLPWPVVIVSPTLVLPGSWPPPPGSLLESEPSGVIRYPSGVEELVLDSGEEPPELDLDAPSEDQIPVVPTFAKIDFEDSAIDLVIEDPSVADSLIAFSAADSVDEPPVRGTLDDMPIVRAHAPSLESVPAIDASAPSLELEPDEDDDGDAPTEVNARDALEDALAALRTGGADELALASDDLVVDEEPEAITATADDLLSLELDDPELGVDPDVVADLGAIGLPSGDTSEHPPVQVAPRPGVYLELGAPSPAVVFSTLPAVWLETVDPAGGVAVDVTAAPPTRPEEDDLQLEPDTQATEDDDFEPDTEPARAPEPVSGTVTLDPADDDVSVDFVLSDADGASVTLEADSVVEPGPVEPDEDAPVHVDLALGAPVPDRAQATAGVAVAPPEPVRSWEGRTGAEQEERTTDLVALARIVRDPGAPPPGAAIQQDLTAGDVAVEAPTDDDWLAELPEAPPEGSMSPHYQDTVPGWLPGSPDDSRGGPKSRRPRPVAPLRPEADTDLGGDEPS